MSTHIAEYNTTGFLGGSGETAALIRAFDWSKTSLGPIERWPQSLKTATTLLLMSPVPIVMLWGPDGYMIYNDSYSVFAGGRHPALLGSKVILVTKGGIGKPIDEVALNKALFDKEGVELLGVIINKVLPEKFGVIMSIRPSPSTSATLM